MADISAIFGSLLIIGITFPGMLSTWWLLFPTSVERAQTRLDQTPAQCFWFGGVLTAIALVPILVLLMLPFGPAQFIGWALIVILLTISSLGSAGIAARMGARLTQQSNISPAAAFLRSAIALELAVFFPVIGWIIVLPLTIVTALGATGFALLRWSPKTVSTPVINPAVAHE